MRICVFGAGAIGGLLAGRLAQGGATVSVVARGTHLAAIRADGLTIRTAEGATLSRPSASADPRDLGVQDVVIVAVKAPALGSVAASIAPLLGPETPVIFAMNGIPWWYFQSHGGELDGKRLPRLDPNDRLWEAIEPMRVIGGVVYSFAEVKQPGVIAVGTAPGKLVMGETDGRPSSRAEAIAVILRKGGFEAEVTGRIRDRVWTKLLGNIASGPFAVLASAPTRDVLASPALERAARQVVREAASIAQAFGCDPGDPEASLSGLLRSAHRPSVLQDLDLGRPMEIDSLYTIPIDFARMAGVATPMLDLLTALVTRRAQAAGLYAG